MILLKVFLISIPYSTIKRNKRRQPSFSLRISIPYSTIKSLSFQSFLCSLLWFQFLIVRLKAHQHVPQQFLAFISIPYSTIKSQTDAQYLNNPSISIPYSTIKRIFAYITFFRSLISIPYSTIKSVRQVLPLCLVILFQFLIVRLKALPWRCFLPLCIFQFLIVRLKENAAAERTA